ncbi:MAG: DM13 domain-containing protein [Chloroflexi bacterium]|nr:DM13 domain-containing protein [Chloroflexota bacterium]
MNTRPAWGALLFGALIVIAIFFSPIWLEQFSGYIEEDEVQAPFPEAFYLLSNEAQDLYTDLYEGDTRQMAIDLVAARLSTPVDVQEANLPAIDPNPGQVQLLLTGAFITIDPLRGAIGTASIYRLSDGRDVLRVEDFDAINGPDLRVLLSAHPRPATKEELDQSPQYQVDLGALKGDQGNQNYLILDPSFNIDNYTGGSVVIYSARYDLVFSYASLTPASSPGL